jgi:hypothetical protein
MRVVETDRRGRRGLVITADFRPNRVDVFVQHGIVTSVGGY